MNRRLRNMKKSWKCRIFGFFVVFSVFSQFFPSTLFLPALLASPIPRTRQHQRQLQQVNGHRSRATTLFATLEHQFQPQWIRLLVLSGREPGSRYPGQRIRRTLPNPAKSLHLPEPGGRHLRAMERRGRLHHGRRANHRRSPIKLWHFERWGHLRG